MTDEKKPTTEKESDAKVHTYRPKRLTTQDVRDGCIYLTNGDERETRVCVVNEELRQGIDFIEAIDKSITIFGSARTPVADPYYQKAKRIAHRAAEAGFAVATGGGPGMMEAGNRGAKEGGGRSIGFTIQISTEQNTNIYVTDEVPFYYFFTRKVTLSYSAEVYIYMPGGFGTLDELFEILTLVQTNKIAKVPVILVGVEFWKPLDAFIKKTLLDEFKTISPEDIDLYTITDDEDQIMEIINSAPIRESD